MGKLTPELIEEYFDVHLPYRTRILLAHYRMTRAPWHGDRVTQNGPTVFQECY